MYRSVHIQNFRCFRDFKIEDLARINLLAGKNNTGKTALLEALYILSLANQPERHLGLRPAPTQYLSVHEMWRDMFTDRRLDRPIRIGANTETRTLELSIQG